MADISRKVDDILESLPYEVRPALLWSLFRALILAASIGICVAIVGQVPFPSLQLLEPLNLYILVLIAFAPFMVLVFVFSGPKVTLKEDCLKVRGVPKIDWRDIEFVTIERRTYSTSDGPGSASCTPKEFSSTR